MIESHNSTEDNRSSLDEDKSMNYQTARDSAANAQLALLLDVGSAPKPGNVDRDHDLSALRMEHFFAGAIGAGAGLRQAAAGQPVGTAFERAVAGMSNQAGGNTQFGCLLLLVPLIRAAGSEDTELTSAGVRSIVNSTTVADSANFYRGFEYVDVAVEDPPEGMAALDVRRGSDAIPTLRNREMTLYDVMDASEDDGNATEWTGGFKRTFETATVIEEDDGPLPDRISRAFVDRLAQDEDTLVRTEHGDEIAAEVKQRAQAARDDPEAIAELDEAFIKAGINPGTTADLLVAATFVALERENEVMI
jgi:Triphosphoribosyl-dephospho-CoA synthetase